MAHFSFSLGILRKIMAADALLISLLLLFVSSDVVAQVTPAPPITPPPEPPVDIVADRVLGQSSFVSSAAGVTASMLESPSSVLADRVSGRLWVSDSANNRVLSWGSANAFANGQPADLVLGQPDFTTGAATSVTAPSATTLARPAGLAVDAQGRLYVADYRNNRVLQFSPPFTNGMAASAVFGKPSFTESTVGQTATAESLRLPQGVAIDGMGNLYVSDTAHNRVVRYTPPFNNGMPADLVLGQSDMINSRQNKNGTATATSLSNPRGLAFDSSGNLYVVDGLNFRVLQYVPPFSNNMAAAQVLGGPDFFRRFVTNAPASSFHIGVNAVATDPMGNVYVADTGGARILQFQAPITTGQAALRAFGQPDLMSLQTNNPTLGPTSLHRPNGVSVDADGDVYIADTDNHRVLVFE